MAKTRKVQVTLEEERYELLSRCAEREGKKLAAVVREAVERYCVGPEAEREKREALESLFSVPSPIEEDYEAWEEEYSRLKVKAPRAEG